jgi:hypothetical protein
MNILNHPSVASEWLSGLDLDGKPHNVVITGVAEVEVPDRTGKATLCVAVAFRTPAGAPLRKRLILRPTHAKALAKLFGLETDNWTGKGITIRPENVQAFGQVHCVVRVVGAAPVKMQQPATETEAAAA